MKSLFFVALIAVAAAHWPYPDKIDKFRPSGLLIGGAALSLDPSFHWTFAPLNNQLIPTFQMRFPHAPVPTHNSRAGLIYTISLDHLAEVVPSSGTFTIVPATMINFNERVWYTDSFTRFYDVESMGEVIELLFQGFELTADAATDFATAKIVDLLYYPTSIRIRAYPDSADDLVDITVHIDNYHFLHTEIYTDISVTPNVQKYRALSQLALFWKISASTGEQPDRNVPLALDFDAMTFEVDADVKFTSGAAAAATPCLRKRSEEGANSTLSMPNYEAVQQLSRASRKAYIQNLFNRTTSTLDHTSSQLWISGGFVALVIGVVQIGRAHV